MNWIVYDIYRLWLICLLVTDGLVRSEADCSLPREPTVRYECVLPGPHSGVRACRPMEPHGTVVIPRCTHHYYASTSLTYMRCAGRKWNYMPKCLPECGVVTAQSETLVAGGRAARSGEVPWHVGLYAKWRQPYQQICGGSLISDAVILSAAHCFWDSTLLMTQPARDFAAAAGKIYSYWGDSHEEGQFSDVREIHVSPFFQGIDTNFQSDIAVVIVSVPFVFRHNVRPVCLDFDRSFHNNQLQRHAKGIVAGWGLTSSTGRGSQLLQVVDLPYVEFSQCRMKASRRYRNIITSDKICAGYINSNISLCKGDSGSGLAFPSEDKSTTRFYLRGIASSTSNDADADCYTQFYTVFTNILEFEHFIKQYWDAHPVPHFDVSAEASTLQAGHCLLPQPRGHQYYTTNVPGSKPGDAFHSIHIQIFCDLGYQLRGSPDASCQNGQWFHNYPTCVPSTPHPYQSESSANNEIIKRVVLWRSHFLSRLLAAGKSYVDKHQEFWSEVFANYRSHHYNNGNS